MNMISTAETFIRVLRKKEGTEELIKKLEEYNPKEFVFLYEENGKTFIGDFGEEDLNE